MGEAIIVLIFLIVFLVLQYREQSQILVQSKNSKVRKSLGTIISLALIFAFWPPSLAERLILISFSLMVLSISFFKQGLAEDGLVVYGLIPFPYTRCKKVTIEKTRSEDDIFVTFYKEKDKTVSFFFEKDSLVMQQLLLKTLPENIEVENLAK